MAFRSKEGSRLSRNLLAIPGAATVGGLIYSAPAQVNFLMHPGPFILSMDPGVAVVAEGLSLIGEVSLFAILVAYTIGGTIGLIKEVASSVKHNGRRSGSIL